MTYLTLMWTSFPWHSFQSLTLPGYVGAHWHIPPYIRLGYHQINGQCGIKYYCLWLPDHGAVHCCLHLSQPQPIRHLIQYRKAATINKHLLRGDIATSTLCIDPVTSAASLLEQYDTTLSTLLDKHVPVLTRTITIRPKVPWFNGDGKMAKQKRMQLERRWRQSRLTIHRNPFKEQRHHVSQLIASATSTYYTAKITEAACDITKLYNVMNALLINPELGQAEHCDLHQSSTGCTKAHLRQYGDRAFCIAAPTRVWFKYVFVFEYNNLVYLFVFCLTITKVAYLYLMFGLYLKRICKYNKINI